MNIVNIFPSSVPFHTASKIFQSNCVPTTTKYVPVRSMWINRVFINLANQDQRNCLTIDCSGRNKNGSGRCRAKADNPEQQHCYITESQNDQSYNVISERIKSGNFEKGIYFKIDRVKSNMDSVTFSAKQKLDRNGTGYDRLSERDRSTDDLSAGDKQDGKSDLQLQPKPSSR